MADEARTKMISMRFDMELMEAIKAIAEREDRTFAAQTHRMLRQWFEAHPDEVPPGGRADKKKGGRR